MKNFKNAICLIATILLVSCSADNIGIQKHTGFTELPFPSNTYQSGQIVEVFSSPRKVEITFDPQIPWDMASTSEGWDISSSEASSIKYEFETKIKNALSASISHTNFKKFKSNL